jgi:hypothetical protein
MTKQDDYQAIVAFLRDIGITVNEQPIEEDTFLPGLYVDRGALFVDKDKLKHPGDLLHEAGHIAVMAPSQREEKTRDVEGGMGDEIAAQAWSYAAAVAAGVSPDAVFHDGGYQGQGAGLAHTYAQGGWPGVPLLAWFGLTGRPTTRPDAEVDLPVFPEMKAWIRTVEDPTTLTAEA